MKKITCKNCGAVFSDDLGKCPYCGTMNKKGAYRNFRKQVSAFIDGMLGLKDETHESISKGIFLSVLRGSIMIVVIVAVAFFFGRGANVNYYNDKEYDLKALEQIEWADQNIEKLDEAYLKGDLETVRKLYYENSSVVSRWRYFPIFSLKEEYSDIVDGGYFNESKFSEVLYFLYYPEYFAGRGRLPEEFVEEYQELRNKVLAFMAEKGFTEQELEEIYHEHADGYGYVSGADLRQYLKEAGNG